MVQQKLPKSSSNWPRFAEQKQTIIFCDETIARLENTPAKLRCCRFGRRSKQLSKDSALPLARTGLGSALIVDGAIAAMELGHLHYSEGCNYEDYLGKQGRKRLGNKKWRGKVMDAVEGFRKALLPDYIVLGGGNAAKLKRMPPQTRRGDNADALLGGFRLWERQSRNAAGSGGSAWTLPIWFVANHAIE